MLEESVFSFLRRRSVAEIDIDELDRLIESRAVRVLDVREDHEFKQGHVGGATNIPLGKLPDRLERLKTDQRYAVICQSGSRSQRAVGILVDHGFEDAVSVRGGTGAWARSGRLLVR